MVVWVQVPLLVQSLVEKRGFFLLKKFKAIIKLNAPKAKKGAFAPPLLLLFYRLLLLFFCKHFEECA
jgi:hypothetical protein